MTDAADKERLTRVERRVEVLEERLANILKSMADRWTVLTGAARDYAAAIAMAIAKKKRPKS